mmetsp:Transcript_23894/g.94770  ORF Transcript_23894/g.94770 Transcript_23894/m.94770 type:complete len:107 (-) Transcript_23894:1565-1885(-)
MGRLHSKVRARSAVAHTRREDARLRRCSWCHATTSEERLSRGKKRVSNPKAVVGLPQGKGISRSAKPYKRSPPQWLKTSPADVEEQVCKLARKGLTPSDSAPRLEK